MLLPGKFSYGRAGLDFAGKPGAACGSQRREPRVVRSFAELDERLPPIRIGTLPTGDRLFRYLSLPFPQTDVANSRFIAVLNRDGGTLRTTNLDAFWERMTGTLEKAGHRVDVECVAGKEIEAALTKAAASRVDVLLAGGGDGTASAAAGMLMGKRKALAILPAGTMNLVARGLGIPLSLDGAVRALRKASHAIDVASANGPRSSTNSRRHACQDGRSARQDDVWFAWAKWRLVRASLATLRDRLRWVLLKVGGRI